MFNDMMLIVVQLCVQINIDSFIVQDDTVLMQRRRRRSVCLYNDFRIDASHICHFFDVKIIIALIIKRSRILIWSNKSISTEESASSKIV